MKRMIVVFFALVALSLTACDKNPSSSSGTNMNHEFLPVEKAFQFSSQQVDAQTVALNWTIAEGYHLYKNKFEFALEPDSARIADIKMPPGVMLDDQTFGKQESYKHQVEIAVKIKPDQNLKQVKLVAKYQGCSEKGLCYPPEKREINIEL